MKKCCVFLSIKCDMPGCNYKVANNFSLLEKNDCISLCATCQKSIYELISKYIVPPAITNAYKKPKKVEKENK